MAVQSLGDLIIDIYIPIGEVSYMGGQISNNDTGLPPDGRGGILRITQEGGFARPVILGDEESSRQILCLWNKK